LPFLTQFGDGIVSTQFNIKLIYIDSFSGII